MDELDLLHDPDDAPTTAMPRVPGEPARATGPLAQIGSPNGAPPNGAPLNGAFPNGAPPPGPPPPGAHRQEATSRPWAWLVAVLAAALLAVAGLVWMIGAAIGTDDTPAPAASTSSPTLSLHPSPTLPLTTEEQPPATASPTPSMSPVTIPPAPSASQVVPTPTPPRTTVAPGLVRVPNVVGDRVRTAVRTLERAGLRVSVVGGDRDNARVLSQQPAGGQVPRGTTVVLYTTGR